MKHVPSFTDSGSGLDHVFVPICSCGWVGWSAKYKKYAVIRALEHAKKENNGDVAGDS